MTFDELDKENRWVKLAEETPWDTLQAVNDKYTEAKIPAKYTFRMAMGTLLIRMKTKMSTPELVESIKENPYMQYFLGLKKFTHKEVINITAIPKFYAYIILDMRDYTEKGEIRPRHDRSIFDTAVLSKEERLIHDLQDTRLHLRVAQIELEKALAEKKEAEKKLKEKEEAKIVEEAESQAVPEVEPTVEQLNEEQLAVFTKAMSGDNLFITGGAGTGKSFLLRQIVASLQEKKKKVLVGAPTGMAARHIEGSTLHRIFGLGVGLAENKIITKSNINHLMKGQYALIQEADVVVIDEISMCRSDYFARIANILSFEEALGHHIQLILCGDFFQLPPVVGKREQEYFANVLRNPQGWPFLSASWKSLHIETVELKTIIRQKNPTFAKALNAVRVGNPRALSYIASHASGHSDKAITLCGTNKAAATINEKALRELLNPIQDYEATYEKPKDKDLDPAKEIASITDQTIRICDGARVIMTVNDPTGLDEYYNGSMGTVVSHTKDSVTVYMDDTHKKVEIHPYQYKVYDYKITKGQGIKKVAIFSFKQMPIRLGWAITVHKSQGQTFRSMVLETGSLWTMEGLLYVALSRASSLEGLALKGRNRYDPYLSRLLKASPVVRDFYKPEGI